MRYVLAATLFATTSALAGEAIPPAPMSTPAPIACPEHMICLTQTEYTEAMQRATTLGQLQLLADQENKKAAAIDAKVTAAFTPKTVPSSTPTK